MPSNDSNKKRKLSADEVNEDEKDAAASAAEAEAKEATSNGSSSGNQMEMQANEEGDKFMQLSGKRRLTVRKFNGKVLVDIREYYTDKEGNDKPGKKGISLSMEQWQSLRDSATVIDAAVADLS